MFSNRRIFVLGLLLLITIISNAQSDKVAAAVRVYQNDDFDSAKTDIDEAIKHPATENDAQAWYIRGLIYEKIYTKREAQNKQSALRTEALYSFKKSISLDTAKEYLKENIKNIMLLDDLDNAKIYIDEAIKHPATENDAEIWYIRGFIYKEIDKKREAKDKQTARKEALYSFQKSINLDTAKEYLKENTRGIITLAYRFNNDAANAIKDLNYKLAIENFEQYKTTMAIIESSMVVEKEIEFNLAIGSVYYQLFESDKDKNRQFMDSAKVAYIKVLSIDTNNISANFGMGLLFYNQAVHLIKQMDYDVDMTNLSDIQDNSIILFKESLPFMEKAYKLDPNRRETIQGLSGIYFSLNDHEKSDEFKRKLEEIKK